VRIGFGTIREKERPMSANRAFGRTLAPLAAFAAGAVVTAALAGVRRRSAPAPQPVQTVAVETRPAPVPAPEPIAPPLTPVAPPPAPVRTPPPPPPAAVPPDQSRADSDTAEELEHLRDEIGRMQRDLAEARASSQLAVLRDLDRHVVGVRDELAQEEASRAARAQGAEDAAARRQQAVEMLIAAQDRLATGDSEVVDQLDAAAPELPLPAQAAIRNAREQIESRDLFHARSWLTLAIAASIRTQLAHD
jgi:hypothetical protein